MPYPRFPASGGADTAQPTVLIGVGMPMPLPPTASYYIERVVVEQDLHRPDSCEITFIDPEGLIVEEARLVIGNEVLVQGPLPTVGVRMLFQGEITSLETVCNHLGTQIIVRAYDSSHRLQRGTRTRTFRESTDADIARLIAGEALLREGEITESPVLHDYIAQFNQTDWEFLQWRAQEIGFETGVVDGLFYFRPATTSAIGAALAEVESVVDEPALLVGQENLIHFTASISAANLTPEVEVRTQDPLLGEAWLGVGPTESLTAELEIPVVPAELSVLSDGITVNIPSSVPDSIPNPAALGAPSNPNARLVFDRPVGQGLTGEAAAEVAAVSLGDQLGSTFAEAEGYAVGDPGVRAGAPVVIEGVPVPFVGNWMVTRTCHTFDDENDGYRTRFWVTGRQDRSLLSLVSGGGGFKPPRIRGVVSGIVTNNFDYELMNRVKLAFPWLAGEYESDWARVALPGGGTRGGGIFIPEVGDEVLVAFEHGDLRRPYVVGGLINVRSEYLVDGLSGPAVEEPLGAVVRRGFATPSGNQLAFWDEMPPGEGPVAQSAVSLGGWRQNIGLRIDQVSGTVLITCAPLPDPTKLLEPVNEAGLITITCPEGLVNIEGGAVTVAATEELTITAPSINIEAEAEMNLSAGAAITANAPIIALNAE